MVWFKELIFLITKRKFDHLSSVKPQKKRKWQTWLWTTLLLIPFNQLLFCCRVLFSHTILRQRCLILGPTGRNATHQIWIELFLGICICSEWKCSDGFTNNVFDFLLNFRTINLTVLRYKSQTTIQWDWEIDVHDCVQFCSVLWWIYHYPHILLHSLNNHGSDFVTSACCVLDK